MSTRWSPPWLTTPGARNTTHHILQEITMASAPTGTGRAATPGDIASSSIWFPLIWFPSAIA